MSTLNMKLENEAVTSFVNDVVLELQFDESELSREFELQQNDNWDSMGLVSVMSLIERHFKTMPDYADVAGCKTFGDLLSLVKH